jgi:REP element-mobilizing transposase RayT
MPHSHTSNLIHCVFSTKHRRSLIPEELQPKLWAYFSGIATKSSMQLIAAGGIGNHAHLLFSLPPTLALSEAVKKLKANSSRWMGEHGVDFEWQEGYSAFSVSPPNAGAVKAYIARQPEHHKKRSFEEEFSELLKKCGVEFDATRDLG